MFDALSDKFDGIFKRIRGETRLTEENMKEAVRDVRLALLDADVNFKVVKDFVAKVREKAVGIEVIRSVRASEQFVKIVHDELVDMMGGQVAPFELPADKFSTILMLGLQGSGKTTFTGKLALRLMEQGHKPMLVACDIHRPAAVEQLKVIGKNIGAPVFEMGTSHPAEKIAAAGVAEAKKQGCTVAIVDTAGRLHIDEVKMDELEAVKKAVAPKYSFFVADAMTGQDAVNSAEKFAEGIGVDGICLTKVDGDTRGGAALSVRAVTGKPIYFIGVGEKSTDLEPFHPDRMAQRILGMGDVLTLVEKAQGQIDEKEAMELQKKIEKEEFTLDDFLKQMKSIKKMGSMKTLMGMIPGVGKALKDIEIDDDMFKPMEAMIHSMTAEERRKPELIDGSRRKRIAKGSGTQVSDINNMLKEFQQSRKMMSQMMKMMGGGMMKGMVKGLMGRGPKPEDLGIDPNDPAAMEAAMKQGLPPGAGMGAGAGRMPGGAMSQKTGGRGEAMGAKMKPKHRRKKKEHAKKKKRR